MKNISLHIFILLLSLLVACTDRNQQDEQLHTLKVLAVKGYVVPKDSMGKPEIIFVDESKLKKNPCGNPKIVLANTTCI